MQVTAAPGFHSATSATEEAGVEECVEAGA